MWTVSRLVTATSEVSKKLMIEAFPMPGGCPAGNVCWNVPYVNWNFAESS
jgi:hypothetical protein